MTSDKVNNEKLIVAARNLLKQIRLQTVLNTSGFNRIRDGNGDSHILFDQDYDISIIVNDDKKAVDAINELKLALGDEINDKTKRLHS